MVSQQQFKDAAYRLQWLNNVRDVPALPRIIRTVSFSDSLAQALITSTRPCPVLGGNKPFNKQISKLAPCVYGSVRYDGKIRQMEFPHPAGYSWLVEELCNNWNSLFPRINNPHSMLSPRARQADGRIVVFDESYNQITNPFGRPSGAVKSTGIGNPTGFTKGKPSEKFVNGKIVNLDISNFFPSIYSHALEWAIEKKRGAASSSVGAKIDRAFQTSRNSRTDGISIGPVTSNVAAELILEPVDELLNKKQLAGELLYARAIDDITMLVSKEVDIESLIAEIAATLRRYSLDLNHSKEEILDFHEYSGSGIQVIVGRFLGTGQFYAGSSGIPAFFADLLALERDYPGLSVVKYAWKMRLRMCSTPDEVEEFLCRSLNSAFRWPHLIPSIVDSMCQPNMVSARALSFYDDIIYSLAYRELKRGSTETSCWVLYLIQYFQLDLWRLLGKFGLERPNPQLDVHAIEEWLTPLVAVMLWSFGDQDLRSAIAKEYSGVVRLTDGRMEDWSNCWPIRYEMFRSGYLSSSKLEVLERVAFKLMTSHGFRLL